MISRCEYTSNSEHTISATPLANQLTNKQHDFCTLRHDSVRQRAPSDSQIRWEKWRMKVKLAIFARENITIDTLLQTKPTHVKLPLELKYETAIENANEYTERGRQIRKSQLKLQWEFKCQKITEAGILCGERPWTLCDQKCVSLLYLSIRTEGRRFLTQIFRHDNI